MPSHPQLSVASFRHDLWSSLHITILLVFSPIRYQVEEDLRPRRCQTSAIIANPSPRLNLGFQVELVADSLVPVVAHLACIPCREPQDPFSSDLVELESRLEHPLMKKGYTTITHKAPM